jgi:hypothetical protein
MTVYRSALRWKWHDVRIWTWPRGVEWNVDCVSCGDGGYLLSRRLGSRATFAAAERLALAHRAGNDAHARYIKRHPLKERASDGD